MRTVSFPLEDRICGCLRSLCVPVKEKNTLADTLKTSEAITLVKTEQYRCLYAILLLGLVVITQVEPEPYPYRPFQWLFRNPATGKAIRDNTLAGALIWYTGLVDLLHSYLKPIGPGDCQHPKFAADGTWYNKTTCAQLKITVLRPDDMSWAVGKMWSVFMHKLGQDPGVVIQIIRFLAQESNLVGHNRALTSEVTRQKPSSTFAPTLSNSLLTHQVVQEAAPYALFYRMLDRTLNQSNPNLTEHCCLCYDTKPPFYEGIAINASLTYSKDPNPIECKWNASRTVLP
ncbi:hypothetical protein HGM15179_016212 [Zosterops borbonicus]|uniref:Uncharacterized protein n=1 Tax=Zosterops borbonicus TaxID=364589 RepID=A0A8K1G3I0_9PASS|nr:hypothetical protein HGM15179_016212 [Zosterops borbonicus]